MTSTIEHPPPSLSFRRLSSTDTRTFLYVNDSPVLEAHRTYETKHLDPSEFWKLMWGKPNEAMFWEMWAEHHWAPDIEKVALLIKLKDEADWSTVLNVNTGPFLQPEEILDLLAKSTHFKVA